MTGLSCPQCGCPSVMCQWWDTETSAGGIYYDNHRHTCTNPRCRHTIECLDNATSSDDTVCPFCGRIGVQSGALHPLDPTWLHWNDGCVPKIAAFIEENNRYEDLPILADALEEAGCEDEILLRLCRGPNVHQHGPWLVHFLRN